MKLLLKRLEIIVIIASLLILSSCFAQKHHKQVPCPCEKRQKR